MAAEGADIAANPSSMWWWPFLLDVGFAIMIDIAMGYFMEGSEVTKTLFFWLAAAALGTSIQSIPVRQKSFDPTVLGRRSQLVHRSPRPRQSPVGWPMQIRVRLDCRTLKGLTSPLGSAIERCDSSKTPSVALR